MQDMAREIRLLAKYGIDTAEQLAAYKDGANAQTVELSAIRKRLRNQTRSITDEDKLIEVKTEISVLSAQITELRREVKLCDAIESRSAEMRSKIQNAREAEEIEKSKTRELMKDEPFRRRR
jgi:chromosome segregation ATPase